MPPRPPPRGTGGRERRELRSTCASGLLPVVSDRAKSRQAAGRCSSSSSNVRRPDDSWLDPKRPEGAPMRRLTVTLFVLVLLFPAAAGAGASTDPQVAALKRQVAALSKQVKTLNRAVTSL